MREHSIRMFPVKPGTPTQGVTARLLLQMGYIKQPTILCPLCKTPIAHTLEADIKALVEQHGGNDGVYITYEITHPHEQQQEGVTYDLDSPEAAHIRSRAVRDITD